MLNTKCFHCGRSFALDTDLAAAWLQEHKDERPKHYGVGYVALVFYGLLIGYVLSQDSLNTVQLVLIKGRL